MRRQDTLVALLVVVMVWLPAAAAAQEPVREFSQLNTRLKPGDTIWVTNAQGREIKGRILSLGTDALTLEDGGDRTFGATDVTSIQVRRPDSLGNGAIIGMAVGGGLSLTACLVAAADDDVNGAGWCALAAVIYGGIGAAVGVGIDALIPGKKLVAYRAPGSAPSSRARLSIAPVVTPRAKGVAIAFAF